MNNRLHCTLLSLAIGLATQSTQAQHIDVLLQIVDNQIVSGAADYDTNTWLVGQKVFERQFLSNFRANDPGFTALESGNPLLESGVDGFAANVDVLVDIVPSTIDGQHANFWYWDGIDQMEDGFTVDDVSFGSAPAGVTWNLFDIDFELFTADGSDTTVSDALVQTAFSDGGVHSHLLMQVADSDGNSQTTPPEGVYLASLVVHAEGYEQSEPLFFVHRTAGLTDEPRDIAAEWVRDNYDALVGETLPGDFNGSGTVDGTDFLVWQRDLGGAAELAIWQDNYGVGALAAQGVATAVPEPATLLLAMLTIASFTVRRRRV